MTIGLVGPLALLLLAAPLPKGSKLEQGQKAFADGDYAAALKALDAAAAVEGADLEKVHLLRAQAFAAQQDFGRAEEAFSLALEANPEASLDPTRVDPSVVRVLDGLRARTRGKVVVRSTPPGATVFLDGKELGVTPLEAQAVIGRHKLEAKWLGGGSALAEVLVRARRETYLEWVQGAAAANPIQPDDTSGRIHPFGEVRGMFEVGGGLGGSMEVGGGVEQKYFRVGLDLRLVPDFGVTPRVALVVPVLPLLSAFIEAEVPLIINNGLAVGLGGLGGVEWHPLRFLGFWLGLGGRHFFQLRDPPLFLNNDRFLLSAGVRLRVP